MIRCYERHKFLYEAKPDLFPEGRLTTTEQLMWDMYDRELKADRESRKNG